MANKTPENETLWKNARSKVHTVLKQAKKSWEKFCSNITQGTTSTDLWNIFSKIKGREPVKTPVFNSNDQYVSDPKEKADLLVNHYQKVSSDEGYDPKFLANKIQSDTRTKIQLYHMRDHTDIGFKKDFYMFELELVLRKIQK